MNSILLSPDIHENGPRRRRRVLHDDEFLPPEDQEEAMTTQHVSTIVRKTSSSAMPAAGEASQESDAKKQETDTLKRVAAENKEKQRIGALTQRKLQLEAEMSQLQQRINNGENVHGFKMEAERQYYGVMKDLKGY